MTWLPKSKDRGPQLYSVVSAAMIDLTRWVYDSHVSRFLRPRQFTTHFHLNDLEGSGRATAVGTFKNLKHFQVEWDAQLVLDWAKDHGWLTVDLSSLNEFALGVQEGARFHTGPIPWSGSTVDSWLHGVPTASPVPVGFTFRRQKCCRGEFRQPVRRDSSRAGFKLLEEE